MILLCLKPSILKWPTKPFTIRPLFYFWSHLLHLIPCSPLPVVSSLLRPFPAHLELPAARSSLSQIPTWLIPCLFYLTQTLISSERLPGHPIKITNHPLRLPFAPTCKAFLLSIHTAYFYFLNLIYFYILLSIVNLQCCISFRCTAQWFSIHTINSFQVLLPHRFLQNFA